MYKKKILAKVKSEDLIFESDNIEEYFKIFDEYAKDDIDKRDFIMDYLTRINLNDPADLIIITIKNFDIINLKNHKF
ncbi:unknown [Coprobacillus sp. CAG:605]|nr:unknown [Coprobacillus sp. CAG:605]